MFPTNRMVYWLGGVNQDNYEKVLTRIIELHEENAKEWITLLITSPGGSRAISAAFYDLVKYVLKPRLRTVGLGEVDSCGMLVFVAGEERLVAPRTTFYFHELSRDFDEKTHLRASELREMTHEVMFTQGLQAMAVADATNGKHQPEEILRLMERETSLNAEELVKMGIAHRILDKQTFGGE